MNEASVFEHATCKTVDERRVDRILQQRLGFVQCTRSSWGLSSLTRLSEFLEFAPQRRAFVNFQQVYVR